MYKERITALMKATKDEPAILDFVEQRINHMIDYVAYVNHMEFRHQRLNIEGITGQEYRDQVTALDAHRRSKHDVAISAVNQLNRLCEQNNLELIYDGEVSHESRNEIGDLCNDICNEYFKGRTIQPLKTIELMKDETDEAFVKSVEQLDKAAEQEAEL